MTDLLAQKAAVAVVVPSFGLSGAERMDIEPAAAYLRSLGLEVRIFPHADRGAHWYPGSDADKVADLHAAFQDPEIKAIFCAHGGAGAQRLLDLLDYDRIAANPKPIIGFSDITALQLAVFARCRQPFISGFLMEYDFRGGTIDPLTDQTLRRVLSGEKITFAGGRLVSGRSNETIEGVLLGECLSMLSDLSGTPYYPDLNGAILLLEDECEKPYKIDLMLTQLRQQPQFKGVRAVIFGAFTDCEFAVNTRGEIREVLEDFAARAGLPVICDFPFGHIKSRPVLPMGVPYRLHLKDCRLEQIA